jgi:hypothetical protein
MSNAFQIDEKGRLYSQVSRCESQDIGISLELTPPQKEDIEIRVSQNGGRPINARNFLPRGFFKNKYF